MFSFLLKFFCPVSALSTFPESIYFSKFPLTIVNLNLILPHKLLWSEAD